MIIVSCLEGGGKTSMVNFLAISSRQDSLVYHRAHATFIIKLAISFISAVTIVR